MTPVLQRHPIAEDSTEQQAAAVQALLEGCTNPGVTRRGLLVRVPDLPPDLRRPHHLRLIEAALDPLRNLDRAGVFHLADGTLLAIWRGEGGARLHNAVRAINGLFADLADSPVVTLDLPADSAVLARAVAASVPAVAAPVASTDRPFDPASLAQLESVLAHADIGPFVRRKSICAWPHDQPARLVWELRQLCTGALAAALAPGIAPRADPWLFRRLTRSFDRRMLTLLADPWELRDAGAFALHLNAASIVGDAFLRFDALLSAPFRTKVLLCLDPADLLAESTGFAFAREFARARGYRLALLGVTPTWLHVFPPDLLGLDYVGVRAPDGPAPPLPAGVAERTILCGVDSTSVLAWGRAQGITLFQGKAVEPDPQTLPRFNLKRKSSSAPRPTGVRPAF